ncbi:MAG: hypothetical protein QW767_00625 [Thermoprotei archaeon]
MPDKSYRIVHVRREVQTLELGVAVEGPVTELIEEFDDKTHWTERVNELRGLGFDIRLVDYTAYAIKPGVRRKI